MSIPGIVKGIKILVMILPIILIVAAGICAIHVSGNGKKKGKKERVKKIKQHFKAGVLLCVLFIACFVAISFVENRLQSNITIGLNYAEASMGLNPNGTRFNSYDIIDDEVLDQAISDGNLGDVTPEELKAALTVQPLQNEQELSTDQYYVSTEYVLSYDATGKTILLDGNMVVESVADAFYDQFLSTYSRKTNVLQVDFEELDEADYLDKVNILSKQISGIQNYLWKCNEENSEYHNDENETFASLATKVADFQEVELEKLKAYILTKGLSNDRNRQISKLAYENLIKDINYQKNTADYNVRLETIDMYERDMASIVLVPTRDDDGEFYMSRTKVAVDNFADEADSASQSAAQIHLEIENNKYAINQLNTSTATSADYTTADNMVESIKNTLKKYSDEAIKMVEDFDSKTKGNYLVLSSDRDRFLESLIKKSVVLCVGMAIALVVLILAIPEENNIKLKKK